MIAIPASPRVDALVQRPQRHQIELGVFTLDDRVPCDHSVREAEAVIMGLDLTSLDARIRANAEAGGRPAMDPRTHAHVLDVLHHAWRAGRHAGLRAGAQAVHAKAVVLMLPRWAKGARAQGCDRGGDRRVVRAIAPRGRGETRRKKLRDEAENLGWGNSRVESRSRGLTPSFRESFMLQH